MNNMDSPSDFNEESPSQFIDISAGQGENATSRKGITASQVSGMMQQAQTFYEQGRLQNAINQCQRILASGIDRPDVRYLLGSLYQQQQHWEDAIDQFQRLLNDSDFALSCCYALGQCYHDSGDLHTAITYFDETVEMVDLDILTAEEANDLIELVQKTAEAHYQAGEQEQAIKITHTLLDFVRSRKWSNQVVQVQFMLDHLQYGLPPRLETTPTPTLVPLEPRKKIHFLSMRQRVMHYVSLQTFFIQRGTQHSRRSPQFLHLVIVLLLIIVSFGSIGIWSYAIQQHSHDTSSTIGHPYRTPPHPSATEPKTTGLTPLPTASATLASSYLGILHDIPTGLTENVSLTKIQLHQNSISGYFGGMSTNGASTGIPHDGSFTGTIDPSKHIRFILMSSTRQGAFSFDGQVTAGSRIVGTYCDGDAIAGKCNDYGIWSISPQVQ